jgi:hypothetical protein
MLVTLPTRIFPTPCAPALWSGELEEEDDSGECVIGDIESDGSSEKDKC